MSECVCVVSETISLDSLAFARASFTPVRRRVSFNFVQTMPLPGNCSDPASCASNYYGVPNCAAPLEPQLPEEFRTWNIGNPSVHGDWTKCVDTADGCRSGRQRSSSCHAGCSRLLHVILMTCCCLLIVVSSQVPSVALSGSCAVV